MGDVRGCCGGHGERRQRGSAWTSASSLHRRKYPQQWFLRVHVVRASSRAADAVICSRAVTCARVCTSER